MHRSLAPTAWLSAWSMRSVDPSCSNSSDCGDDGFCSEEGICEWPQSECPAEAPHPCYNENNELVSCEMDEFACHGDGSNHSGPRDCSFNEATCDAQNGEACYALVDEQGARAYCLTPCDPEANECGDGLQCRRGDGGFGRHILLSA